MLQAVTQPSHGACVHCYSSSAGCLLRAFRCNQSSVSALFGLLSSCGLWSQACCPILSRLSKPRAFHPFCDGLHNIQGERAKLPRLHQCLHLLHRYESLAGESSKASAPISTPTPLAHKIAHRWSDKVQSAARRPAPSEIPHAQTIAPEDHSSSSFVSGDQRPVSTPMSNGPRFKLARSCSRHRSSIAA